MLMNSPRLLLAAVSVLSISLTGSAASNTLQRFNLPEKPTKPRFELHDRDWPAAFGAASICLWKDDALAAFSITVDDNCAMDVPWWLEQSKALKLPITWFLITANVDNPKERPHMNGTWALWKSVLDQGNAAESHTATHWGGFKPDGTPPEGWKGIEWEYAQSIKQIEAGIPGHKVRCLAYSGGPGQNLHDRNIAAKYYIAARTANGTNPANQIDYMMVRYTPFPQLDQMFDPKSNGYRGWSVVLSHFVGNEKFKAAISQYLDYYKQHASELWGGLFGDVAKYGQERDTAKLEVKQKSPSSIVLSVADEMDDKIYDFPLTVKVRLDPSWKSVNASQNAKAVEATIVQHEGAPYALVQVVPDRGDVTLQK